MAIETLIPTSVVSNGGNYSPQGAPSVIEAIDELTDPDLTHIVGSSANTIVVEMSAYTLASNERCLRARARVQAEHPSSTFGFLALGDGFETPAAYTTDTSFLVTSPLGWFNTGWSNNPPGPATEWTQTRINAIVSRFSSSVVGIITARVYKWQVELDIRRKPSVAITPLAADLSTRRPTVAWTPTIFDGQEQLRATVRIYDLSENASPNPDIDAAGLVYTSGDLTGTNTSKTIDKYLGDGTYRAFVRVAKDFNDEDWWSNWDSDDFGINEPPPVPTLGLAPGTGATINTDRPTLGVRIAQANIDGTLRVRAEWQLATDAGFTTNVRNVIEPEGDLDAGGLHTEVVPAEDELFQGNWYVRARAVDGAGTPSGWSSANQFTVSHPPGAINRVPADDKTFIYGDGEIAFTWQFTDTSPGDTQTAHQIRVERNTDGSLVVDTTKVANDEGFGLVVIPVEDKDLQLRWAVKLWDSDDVSGDWSPYNLFRVSDGPSVTVTQPSDVVTHPQPTIEWDFDAPNGRTQSQHRVLIRDEDGLTIYQTGWIAGADLLHALTRPALANNTTYTIFVYVMDSVGLESSDSHIMATEWIAPDAASGTAISATAYDEFGYVATEWDRNNEDADFDRWRVYRRVAGIDVSWTLLIEVDESSPLYVYRDFTAASDVEYEYAVVQVALRFGVQVESEYEPLTVTPSGSHYWLLDPSDYGKSIKLPHVTADSFTDEYEQAELLIIGRGRHVDFGTRYGYRGQLTASVRDDSVTGITAREQRLALERIKRDLTHVYLRNPFGDVWAVTTQDIQIEREAGLGKREFVIATIPYAEVYED